MADTCMSDHAPVMLVVSNGTRRIAQSLHIPNKLQVDGTLKKHVEEIWLRLQCEEGYHAQAMALGLQQISGFLRTQANRHLAQIK